MGSLERLIFRPSLGISPSSQRGRVVGRTRWSAYILAALAVVLAGSICGRASAQTPEPISPVQSHATPEQNAEWTRLNAQVEAAYLRGEFAQGVELGTRALALAERAFGPDHPNTLTSTDTLALIYDAAGRYGEAEPLHIRALEGRERVLGRDHQQTLESVGNFGIWYGVQGRYAEAEPLYLRALQGNERVLGRDNPQTLTSVNNLAWLYQAQGRYAEAEPLYIRALEASERTLGRDHADTLGSVNNLAVLYKEQGRYAEAELLYVRALEANERVLGSDHPQSLLSIHNLADLYTVQGRYAEAERLNIRALEVRERVLGREHPDTLSSINNLAALYVDQGRYSDAEPFDLRLLEVRQRTLGREHPDTLMSISNLAFLYKAQGRYTEAEPLYVRALEANERVLGREHPQTLNSIKILADLYEAQGRYAEAEPLYIRALEAYERTLGREHPDTIKAAVGLTIVRLSSPLPESGIGPARLAIGSLRSRRLAARTGAFAEAQRVREESQTANNFLLLADAAWAAASTRGADRAALAAESLTALQDATTGTTNRAVIEMAIRHVADATNTGLGALVRERESLNDQWAVNSASYSTAVAASDANAETLRRLLGAQRIRIEARMDAVDAILRRDFPQYFSLVRPEALDLASTQAMLAPDEAILLVVPTQFGTHVMAIDRTGIDWVRSAWTRTEVDGAVGQLLGNIRVAMAGGRQEYDRQTAYALYRQAVEPVGSRLEGKRHLFVVTAGALTSLPLGILVTEEPLGANDDPQALRTTHWFADAHALIAIPSIQSLQFLRRYGRRPGPTGSVAGGFVGFGNPVLDGPPNHPEMCARGGGRNQASVASVVSGRQTRSGGMLASVSLIRTLCPLPGTAAELENMRTAFHAPRASVFGGARSTEHSFRTMDLTHARILALATHGLVAGEVSGASEPGLVFTPPATATDEDDGYVTASEVSALRLDADWVILSACNTATGDGSTGAAGLSGLARAFFYAGARNLLASHWPVADDAGARLTVRTIQLMREHPGFSRAKALQRSMREIRDDPRHPEWAHPGAWAPFSLIGDGAH